MNKEKYLDNLFKKKFLEKTYFKKVVIEFNDYTKVTCDKIFKNKDLQEYVKPLDNIGNDGFLVSPRTSFSTIGFNVNVDLIMIDSDYKVTYLFNNVSNNKKFNFNWQYNSIIIVKKGFIKFNNIKIGDVVKFNKWYKE